MIRCHGSLTTAEPGRYLSRLCFHFSKKIEVSYTEHEGHARFVWGECRLKAEGDTLHFDCEAAAAEQLAQVRHVIDAHVALFSRKAPMVVRWQVAQSQVAQ